MENSDCYFAYGVHLDTGMMKRLCAEAEPAGLARLPDHAFIMTPSGTAGLVSRPGSEVWGRLWRIKPSCLAALESRSGIPKLYSGQRLAVELPDGSRLERVLVYVNQSRKTGQSTTGYIYTLVAAARQAGLPQAWIERLADLNP
jgi:gamma-glutamylcyclotransferase (GGCT)/AIG2-like uncharacterized protein YtfP